jgi:mannitol-specific phosphotransferase system IIBC component
VKKLVAEFVFKVYDDGSYEVRKLLKTDKTDLPERVREASSRTTQAIMVILKMHHMKKQMEKSGNPGNIDYTKIYNKALQDTARDLNLQVPTVRDKLERKMKKSADDVVKLLENFFENNDMTIKEELKKSIRGTYKEDQDILAIEELFRYIERTT